MCAEYVFMHRLWDSVHVCVYSEHVYVYMCVMWVYVNRVDVCECVYPSILCMCVYLCVYELNIYIYTHTHEIYLCCVICVWKYVHIM